MGCRAAKPVLYTCGYCDFPYCECKSHVRRPDLRIAMYHDIRDAVYEREYYRKTAMYFVFVGIFKLRNAHAGRCTKCCARWFQDDNLSEQEIKFMRHYLPRFAEIFIAMPSLPYEHCERKMLSGLVIFRTELLPIFREAIGTDTDFTPLIRRVLHWESVIRDVLSGRPEKHPDLFQCYLNKHLSDYFKQTHRWWSEEFIDNENLNASEEYSLTD